MLSKYWNEFILLVIAILVFAWSFTIEAQTIKVMVIDTGIYPHKDFKSQIVKHEAYDENYIDDNTHGTHIAGIIMKDLCSQVQLISCKYLVPGSTSEELMKRLYSCYTKAIKERIDVVNYSSVGEEPDIVEYLLVKQLQDNKTTLVTSVGNEDLDISHNPRYPAMYEFSNIIPVGNLDQYSNKNWKSNYGLKNMVWEMGTNVLSTAPNDQYKIMTGTSQATAVHTNKLLKKKCQELKWQQR